MFAVLLNRMIDIAASTLKLVVPFKSMFGKYIQLGL